MFDSFYVRQICSNDFPSSVISSLPSQCLFRRVRMLFEHDYSRGKTPRFRFIDLIEGKDMKVIVMKLRFLFLPLYLDRLTSLSSIIENSTKFHVICFG